VWKSVIERSSTSGDGPAHGCQAEVQTARWMRGRLLLLDGPLRVEGVGLAWRNTAIKISNAAETVGGRAGVSFISPERYGIKLRFRTDRSKGRFFLDDDE
jgi:hypothetical protein